MFHPRRAGERDVFEDVPRPIWLYVGRVAVEKNIEAFVTLDLPGTKVVVGDGPQREALETAHPEVRFLGAKFDAELAAHYAGADVFAFPSLTDTFGLVILEAWGAGTPVAAFPAPGPIDIIPGTGAGVLAESTEAGLREACLEALKIDRGRVRDVALGYSWHACAEEFLRLLEPYPEPHRSKFWRRLRRLARLKRGTASPRVEA